MIKYDDFAMPSLENIENMAKAYAEMEKQLLSKNQSVKESENVVNDIYNAISMIADLFGQLCKRYPKNDKFLNLYGKCRKTKVEFESDFVLYDLRAKAIKYNFNESVLIYDLIKICIDAISLIMLEIKNDLFVKKYSLKILDIMKFLVS